MRESVPKFLNGVFSFTGAGYEKPLLLSDKLAYHVPPDKRSQLTYFRAGNSSDEMIYVIIIKDSAPMRYFPVGAKSSLHVSLAVVEDLEPTTKLEVFFGAPSGATARQSFRAAVIGGGLLGLKAARGLLNHDCEVHVVHLAAHLMEMQLDAPGGSILKTSMEKMGVIVHLEKSTSEVLGEDRVTGLAFKDGSTLECDMLVIAAGIRPNAEIGRSARPDRRTRDRRRQAHALHR